MSSNLQEKELQALAMKNGYNISLKNRLRKYGPPVGWTGPRPSRGSKILIANLPKNTFEPELVQLCKRFGKIFELYLMLNCRGESHGYCFVTFTYNLGALRAVKGLDKLEIRPHHPIEVCRSIDNCSLYIGGIPSDKNEDEITKEIRQFTTGLYKVTPSKGFVLHYENRQSASAAKQAVTENSVKFKREVIVDWAQPEMQVQDNHMKKMLKMAGRLSYIYSDVMKTLCVHNVAPLTSEDRLYVVFSIEGALEVEMVKKMHDFALIYYTNREDAEIGIEEYDGAVIDGYAIQVTWAKSFEMPNKQIPTSNILSGTLSKLWSKEGLEKTLQKARYPLFPRYTMPSSLTVPDFPKSENLFTVNKPIELLNYICAIKGWGDPKYHLTRIQSEGGDFLFVCRVLISGQRLQKFINDKACKTPEEAKLYAACCVLKKLRVMRIDICASDINLVRNSNLLYNFPRNSSLNNVLLSESGINTCVAPPVVLLDSIPERSSNDPLINTGLNTVCSGKSDNTKAADNVS
ncbi:APOBEC1 complementation factor [Nephila pilipes]|uniref:APOBEC1 complementation factor n=1 Tax=Nephila pilipes TaxID=299642 RepID=A0A8X6QAP4_NEPPI|nr:APOBEC1 complementation factor [Nephila pilipes]